MSDIVKSTRSNLTKNKNNDLKTYSGQLSVLVIYIAGERARTKHMSGVHSNAPRPVEPFVAIALRAGHTDLHDQFRCAGHDGRSVKAQHAMIVAIGDPHVRGGRGHTGRLIELQRAAALWGRTNKKIGEQRQRQDE
jgi:hypothetical protein